MSVTRRFYRILQRQCQQLRREAKAPLLFLQPPIDPHRAGSSRVFNMQSQPADAHRILRLFSNWTADDDLLREWVDALVGRPADDFANVELDSVWANVDCVAGAIRQAFRESPALSEYHAKQWSIRAYQILTEQACLARLSSVSETSMVRISATSRCIGRTIGSDGNKYRFAYRIRIENVAAVPRGRKKRLPANGDRSAVIQLLGRSWIIEEHNAKGEVVGDPIRVHAPNTGAVGKLPVLHPGQAFEYMSGCEIATETGLMRGAFHFGHVGPDTESAMVGTHVEAFDDHEARFEVTVEGFSLVADDSLSFTP